MSTMAPSLLPLACPHCRRDVFEAPAFYACEGCGAVFPMIAGIADFRVKPDPWIGIEEDREKALRIVDLTQGLDFEASVRKYWEITPETPKLLADRFIEHVLRAPARSREWLTSSGVLRDGSASALWLDLGCGTADLLAAVPDRPIVGIDVALRWLVIARKRFEQGDVDGRLVCCSAERLPFRDGSFDGVLSLGLLEHLPDERPAVEEAFRVLKPGGRISLRTTNRYTLMREPHTGVRGVGFVPRPWADTFVRRRSGQRYVHHRPLSARELGKGMRDVGFERVRVRAAISLPSESAQLGTLQRFIGVYEWARRSALLGSATAWVAPLLEAEGVKR
jgi:SAM-dependent methyltransferase